jgi:hypothetical protein
MVKTSVKAAVKGGRELMVEKSNRPLIKSPQSFMPEKLEVAKFPDKIGLAGTQLRKG